MKRRTSLMGVLGGLVVGGLLLAGCPAKVVVMPPPAKVPGAVAPGPATTNVMCVNQCITRNQMRAVSIDQIERDCRAECAKTCVTACITRSQMKAVSPAQIEADCKKGCGQ